MTALAPALDDLIARGRNHVLAEIDKIPKETGEERPDRVARRPAAAALDFWIADVRDELWKAGMDDEADEIQFAREGEWRHNQKLLRAFTRRRIKLLEGWRKE